MSKATAALEEYQRKVRDGEIAPPKNKTPWEKLDEHPTSLRAAVNAMCADCMGWPRGEDREAGIVQMIRECSAPTCALYAVRPYKPHPGDDE